MRSSFVKVSSRDALVLIFVLFIGATVLIFEFLPISKPAKGHIYIAAFVLSVLYYLIRFTVDRFLQLEWEIEKPLSELLRLFKVEIAILAGYLLGGIAIHLYIFLKIR